MKKFNRIAVLALTVSLTVGLYATAANAATITYTDTQGNWAQADIDAATRLNIMRGYSDNTFQPNAWMTRSEFVNMGLAALGLGPDKIEVIPSFRDVSRNNWNFKNIEQAEEADLLEGYPENVFRPENPIRRAEALVAVANASDVDMVSEAEANQILSAYSDADQVPDWARVGVATAIKNNLFANEQANLIEPMAPATRADVAVMLTSLAEVNGIAKGESTTVGTSTVRTTTDTTGATTTTTTTRTTTMTTTTEAPLMTLNLPANTTFTGTVAKGFYSEFNKPGDEVLLILERSIIGADGRVIIPAGSRVHGEITSVEKYNDTDAPAMMTLNFNEVVLPTGERYAINGSVASADGTLRADNLQGVVIRQNHSAEGLKSEMRMAQGALVGTYQGKVYYLEEPMVSINSTRPLTEAPFRPDIVIGVGDRLQVKLDGTVTR